MQVIHKDLHRKTANSPIMTKLVIATLYKPCLFHIVWDLPQPFSSCHFNELWKLLLTPKIITSKNLSMTEADQLSLRDSQVTDSNGLRNMWRLVNAWKIQGLIQFDWFPVVDIQKATSDTVETRCIWMKQQWPGIQHNNMCAHLVHVSIITELADKSDGVHNYIRNMKNLQ